MAALVKKTHNRFSRWCRDFVAKNKTPQRWYEFDGPGIA